MSRARHRAVPNAVAPFDYLRFLLLPLWARHRAPLLMFAVASVVLASGAAAWLFAGSQRKATTAELITLPAAGPKAAPLAHPIAEQREPALPSFDGRQIVEAFNAAAHEIGLPLEEVAYGLEAGNDQPYLRYRISTSVKTGYPQIRRFVAALAAGYPNVSLDGVRCARENSAAAALKCELSFSAFYRRGTGG